MDPIDRRAFLVRGSAVIAAAGVATAVPNFLGAGTAAGAAAHKPVLHGDGSASSSESSEDLVAHIRDLGTGEIGLYTGEHEIIFHDREVATRLFNATR